MSNAELLSKEHQDFKLPKAIRSQLKAIKKGDLKIPATRKAWNTIRDEVMRPEHGDENILNLYKFVYNCAEAVRHLWLDEKILPSKEHQLEMIKNIKSKVKETNVLINTPPERTSALQKKFDPESYTGALEKAFRNEPAATVVEVPVVAPFPRFYVKDELFTALDMDYYFMGGNDNSDYVILTTQKCIAINISNAKAKGVSTLDEANRAVKNLKGANPIIVSDEPRTTTLAEEYAFYWILPQQHLDVIRARITSNTNSENWGLAV